MMKVAVPLSGSENSTLGVMMMELNRRAIDDLYIEKRLFRVLEPAIRSDNVFSINSPFCPPYAPGWFE
jgi:hypothetical protein